MTAFAAFIGEKVERYIELRRFLDFGFNKQAATLRAFVRYVECSQLDAPANRTMALASCRSAASPTVAPFVTACSADFTST